MKRPAISIIGPGRLGSALALRLYSTGYPIAEIVSRKRASSLRAAEMLAKKVRARPSHFAAAKLDANLIWLCVPDSQIAEVASQLSRKNSKAQFIFHSSGVVSSDVLAPLKNQGAAVASVHPLMTFIDDSVPDLKGVTFAIEGDASAARLATAIVKSMKGIPRPIRKQDKPAYHAFATLICPLLISLLASAERAATLAGLSTNEARQRMLPIIQQTLANYMKSGPAKSFTGPIVRGDVETVAMHLAALAKTPVAQSAYAALAQAALELLPARKKNDLKKLLGRFSSRPSR